MNNDHTYQQPLCSPCATCDESNTTTTRKRDENETRTTASDTVRCVPQKRFPEFHNAGEWKPIALGNVAKVKSGYAFKSTNYKKSGRYKIITIRNVQNGYLDMSDSNIIDVLPDDIQSYQILKEGDILISMTGNVGRVCKVNQSNCLLNQRVGLVSIFNNDLDKDFIYSLLTDIRFQQSMIESGQGAAQANISNKDIESYTFAYPESKEEQRKIAACLLTIDDEIATTTLKLEQLKTHKNALLQKLFPQRGKTTPELRFPEFQDAGDWKSIALGNVARVKNGYAFKSTDYNKSGKYKIITIRNVQNGYMDMSDNNSIDILPDDIQSYQILKEDDILVSMTGNVGRVCKVNQSNCLLNQRVGLIVIFNDDFEKDYIYSILLDSRFQRAMIESGQGAAQANISSKDIESYTFAYPESNVEQQKIASCLQSIDDEIFETTNKLKLLQEQKKVLMQQLFSHL